jgi:hypothetical protein
MKEWSCTKLIIKSTKNMHIWNFCRVNHSRKNAIDIYCRQLNDFVEFYITNASEYNFKILAHDIMHGQINDILQDQKSNQINWEKRKFDFTKLVCEFDMAQVRKKQGTIGEINFLHYHVANAINQTHTNKAFSRYIKKQIIGKWIYEDFSIIFNENLEYQKMNSFNIITPFKSLFERGRFNLFRNMLYFEGIDLIGLRIQIIDLVDNKLLFGGLNKNLYFILEKV